MPLVTVAAPSIARAYPKLITSSPTASLVASPNSRVLKFPQQMLTTARSRTTSTPNTFPVYLAESFTVTLTLDCPSTTCQLVTTYPVWPWVS